MNGVLSPLSPCSDVQAAGGTDWTVSDGPCTEDFITGIHFSFLFLKALFYTVGLEFSAALALNVSHTFDFATIMVQKMN